MAANLTPQYLEAEAEYKKAQTAEEKLTCLKKMYALLPKHKASEKLQAELKSRMSELRDEIEHEKKSPKKVGVSYKIPKQGAGQYVLLGAPNAGKSQFLNQLTRAKPQVAPFPFTTREPQAGMAEWQDTRIQLVDTPPITADFMESYLSSIVRSADAALLFVDLGDDDGPFAAEAVIERLAQTKTILAASTAKPDDEDSGILRVKTLVAANKIDVPGATERLKIVQEWFGDRFAIHAIAAEHGTGLMDLLAGMYQFLNVIRVYTKQPGKPPDMSSPFTPPAGSTILDLAALIHRDLAANFKFARVWGTSVHDGQTVKRDYVLHDKDVVELHV
ncbi:MAG: GTPase [Gemmataceae bacterium]